MRMLREFKKTITNTFYLLFVLTNKKSPLIVLFLGDLLHLNQNLTYTEKHQTGQVLRKMKPIEDLVQKLSHSKLKLRQLLLLCHVGIVNGVLPNLKK